MKLVFMPILFIYVFKQFAAPAIYHASLCYLEEKKHCTINFLADKFYVTPITTRRDIKLLEQEGLVNKCYGGVSVVTHNNREVPLIVREANNSENKTTIAAKAAKLITDGSTVFLYASSTAAHIVDFLAPEQGVTIITNSIKTLTRLAERGITSYGTGGKLLRMILADYSFEKNPSFNPTRKSMTYFRDADTEEKNRMIKENPAYGRIVCRCEGITEGEIIDAITTNPKAADLDGIKRRTRAQMGRCQGGFCSPSVIELLSKKLNIP